MQTITANNFSFLGLPQFLTHDSIILTDLDGTVLPLIHDPAKRFINPKAFEAFTRFAKISPGHVTPITGRDWEQVVACFHNKTPIFPVISSNGAQMHIPGGKEITHLFTLPEQRFLRKMHISMSDFKTLHPELVTEIKRFEIGFHSEATTGYGHFSRDFILKLAGKCEAMLVRLEDEAKKYDLNFRVASTEVTAQEMSHGEVDKLMAIQKTFVEQLPAAIGTGSWENVVYLGDSLRKGNDRVIATEVRKRGGRVCQVINGSPDRVPPADDPAHPNMVFEDPEALGAVLLSQVEQMERAPIVHQVLLRGITHG